MNSEPPTMQIMNPGRISHTVIQVVTILTTEDMRVRIRVALIVQIIVDQVDHTGTDMNLVIPTDHIGVKLVQL